MEPIIKNLGKIRPTIEGNHNINIEYDVLCIVYFEDKAYMSKQKVPVGIPITNTEYWDFFGIVEVAVIKGTSQTISVILPKGTNVASGDYSVALGNNCKSTGFGAFTCNSENEASGNNSHAEGYKTKATNANAHAEGDSTQANGYTSHSEGDSTQANGYTSHSEGLSTITYNESEHAEGKYNVCIPNQTIHTVGIGATGIRKNAHIITIDGKHYILNIGGYTGIETNLNNIKDLASVISTFITNSVDDLTNYYLKSQLYTKNEVESLIGAISNFHYEIYTTLPTTGENNVLYLIGPTGTGEDKYEEYIYPNVERGWVKIGDTTISLSQYVTISNLNNILNNYITNTYLTNILNNYTLSTNIPIEKGTGQNSIKQKNVTNVSSGRSSVAFGENTLSSGDVSFSEGRETKAKGAYSHTEGYNTEAVNSYEHAEGRYNKSNKASDTYGNAGNTQHSVGIGTDVDVMNAFEIMQNGDAYLIGVGRYNGTNPNTAKSIQQIMQYGSVALNNGEPYNDYSSVSNALAEANCAGNPRINFISCWDSDGFSYYIKQYITGLHLSTGTTHTCIQLLNDFRRRDIELGDFDTNTGLFPIVSVGEWVTITIN